MSALTTDVGFTFMARFNLGGFSESSYLLTACQDTLHPNNTMDNASVFQAYINTDKHLVFKWIEEDGSASYSWSHLGTVSEGDEVVIVATIVYDYDLLDIESDNTYVGYTRVYNLSTSGYYEATANWNTGGEPVNRLEPDHIALNGLMTSKDTVLESTATLHDLIYIPKPLVMEDMFRLVFDHPEFCRASEEATIDLRKILQDHTISNPNYESLGHSMTLGTGTVTRYYRRATQEAYEWVYEDRVLIGVGLSGESRTDYSEGNSIVSPEDPFGEHTPGAGDLFNITSFTSEKIDPPVEEETLVKYETIIGCSPDASLSIRRNHKAVLTAEGVDYVLSWDDEISAFTSTNPDIGEYIHSKAISNVIDFDLKLY